VRVSFEASFARDLRAIKDRRLLEQVAQVIAEVKIAGDLSALKHLSKLHRHPHLYRIRLGDYRIGIEVVGDEVIFVRILHRKDIYRLSPKIKPPRAWPLTSPCNGVKILQKQQPASPIISMSPPSRLLLCGPLSNRFYCEVQRQVIILTKGGKEQ